ncbi:MAG TPA: serine/threonine-protein kinase, partial [Vicinamibacterales bacterium]
MDPASWERVKDVLAEAVKLPAAERDAFVESQNLPPDLREKVLEILSAWKDTTPFLKTVPSTIEADVILRPGAIIGPYEINDLIGEGGMGRVYLANDRQLRRRVALKCLKGPADATIIKEAIAAAQLNHPNVAAVYHVIEQGQTLFIVMEYVDGENLAERLKRERLPMLQAVVIGQRLSSALAAAHSKGIIHRDLKPGNVQFTKDGTPKVLDFGIARLAQTMTVTSNASTTGQTVSLGGPHPGTPPYMSPEQLGGRDLDERSDIFSLGVLLFEMTTGRRPFPSSDRGELKELQAKGAPRADSVDPKVSRALADVIARSLDTDRLRRTQSALEVEAALDDVARRLRPKVIRELIRLWLARVAIGVPIALTGIVLAGFIVTVGFNTTFGRDADFARFGVEPLTGYFRWG